MNQMSARRLSSAGGLRASRSDDVRVETSDAFPFASFTIRRADTEFHLSKRRFVVGGGSRVVMRAGLGPQLRVRTFTLYDDLTHAAFRACYLLEDGPAGCTFTFESRRRIT